MSDWIKLTNHTLRDELVEYGVETNPAEYEGQTLRKVSNVAEFEGQTKRRVSNIAEFIAQTARRVYVSIENTIALSLLKRLLSFTLKSRSKRK
jgi:CBS domain containing-hemolysin-like protein